MNRAILTDDSGRWFDIDKATRFDEDTEWNGNNHISCATRSQWDHERLYRTAGGRWIVYHWSQWQGSTPHYTEISETNAAKWLSINDHEPPAVIAEHFAALEIA